MDRDTISRTAAQALVAGGALLTVAALLGPASWRQGEAHGKPAVAVLVTIFLLGPALSALCAVMTRLRPPRKIAAVAGGGALIAAVAAAASSAGEATLDGLAGGGPLAAVAAAITAVGWLVAALTPGAQGPVSWVPLASATVLVLLVGWLGPAAVHAAARAGVDARTADRPFAAAAVPSGLGDRWTASVPGTVVVVSAGLVLVRDKAGVRTLDAASGRAAWRYLREGRSMVGLGPAAGGRVVVGLWHGDGQTRAIGFDTATGSRRWDRRLDASTVDHQVVGSGALAVLVPRGAGTVVALDANTGRRRWTWRPANGACVTVGGATSAEPARDDAVAIAFSCPEGRRVAGLSTSDGSVRWTWAPATGSDTVEPPPRGTAPGGSVPGGYAPLLVGTAGGVLVNDGGTGLVLSLTSGRSGGIHPAGGRLAAAVDTTALYVGSGGAVAVDLAFGRERWRMPLPAATTPVAVAGLAGAGFGLVVPDRGGAARVLRLDMSTGAVAAERQVDDAAVSLWVGPGVLVLATSAGQVIGLA
jgi:outer membrane protein assembly factor BamB